MVTRQVLACWSGLRSDLGQESSSKSKRNVYKRVAKPARLFGLQTVALTKRQEAELQVADIKILRFSLGVMKMDRSRNEHQRTSEERHRLDVLETRLERPD